MWNFVEWFVVGESIESVIQVVQVFECDGIVGNFDLFGEFIDSLVKCIEFVDDVIKLIEVVYVVGIKFYVSIKLSSVGQGKDENGEDFGLINVCCIIVKVKEYGGFICLDMEDYMWVDVMLEQFCMLVGEFGVEYVGIVL